MVERSNHMSTKTNETKLFQKRVDAKLYSDVDEMYRELGTSVGEAFVMFLKKSKATGGLPFELKLSEAEKFKKYEQEQISAALDDVKSGRVMDFDDVDWGV
jgi:antitoxin component of RelBE/YafQ-DinJ toxin-antitoxin module